MLQVNVGLNGGVNVGSIVGFGGFRKWPWRRREPYKSRQFDDGNIFQC